MRTIATEGKYIVIKQDGQVIFKSPREQTKFIDSGQSVKIYHDTKTENYEYASLDGNSLKDEDGDDINLFDWLSKNTGEKADNITKSNKEIAGDTYLLLNSDASKFLIFTSATDVTITLPEGLLLDADFEGVQNGVGKLLFVGGGSVTITKPSNLEANTLSKGSWFKLRQLEQDNFLLSGILEETA